MAADQILSAVVGAVVGSFATLLTEHSFLAPRKALGAALDDVCRFLEANRKELGRLLNRYSTEMNPTAVARSLNEKRAALSVALSSCPWWARIGLRPPAKQITEALPLLEELAENARTNHDLSRRAELVAQILRLLTPASQTPAPTPAAPDAGRRPGP
jgi:hypothetical protein